MLFKAIQDKNVSTSYLNQWLDLATWPCHINYRRKHNYDVSSLGQMGEKLELISKPTNAKGAGEVAEVLEQTQSLELNTQNYQLNT
jgi:hypothetical protein